MGTLKKNLNLISDVASFLAHVRKVRRKTFKFGDGDTIDLNLLPLSTRAIFEFSSLAKEEQSQGMKHLIASVVVDDNGDPLFTDVDQIDELPFELFKAVAGYLTSSINDSEGPKGDSKPTTD